MTFKRAQPVLPPAPEPEPPFVAVGHIDPDSEPIETDSKRITLRIPDHALKNLDELKARIDRYLDERAHGDRGPYEPRRPTRTSVVVPTLAADQLAEDAALAGETVNGLIERILCDPSLNKPKPFPTAKLSWVSGGQTINIPASSVTINPMTGSPLGATLAGPPASSPADVEYPFFEGETVVLAPHRSGTRKDGDFCYDGNNDWVPSIRHNGGFYKLPGSFGLFVEFLDDGFGHRTLKFIRGCRIHISGLTGIVTVTDDSPF